MLAAHVLAAVLWIGGLAFMLFVIPVLDGRASRGKAAETYSNLYARFGNIAVYCVAVLLGTGVYNALFNAPNPGGIAALSEVAEHPLGTQWLLVLVVKVVLFASMGAIAGFMRFKVAPELAGAQRRSPKSQAAGNPSGNAMSPQQRMRRLSRINLVIGCAVILLAVTLGYLHVIGHALEAGA